MSIQSRISVTLSLRMRKALELAAGFDGSTTASYATQLLASAIKEELKNNPILNEKMTQLDKQALKEESWDSIVSPMTIPNPNETALLKGWFLSGDTPDEYNVGEDKRVLYKNNGSGFIRSKRNHVKGFGTLMQQVDIANHIGKKLRFTAIVKTEDVKNWAGLWVRIDDVERQVLWFDNMQDKSIKGTVDWKRFGISFNVPKEGATLSFGVLLVGAGSVWINDVSINQLSGQKEKPLQDLPVSLGFSID
ncbi:MAG TPA: hypothetical protein VK712_04535 [Verrucomicrobiae bacterium]|nr:hypothetical protein [Verrucomicrobiae bacterium]